jgi:hypothetical protein
LTQESVNQRNPTDPEAGVNECCDEDFGHNSARTCCQGRLG